MNDKKEKDDRRKEAPKESEKHLILLIERKINRSGIEMAEEDGWRCADQAALDAAYRKGQENMRERAAETYFRHADICEDAVERAIRALPIQGGDDAA